MADERKVFPVETVLELVAGKNDADVKEIAGFILGRSLVCDDCAKAAAPFAAAWLARWYPRFMDLEWNEGQSWEAFVRRAKGSLGDNISLTPMTGRLKTLANQVLNILAETNASLARQTDAAMRLEEKIRELEPLEGAAEAARQKCDQLEAKLKETKSQMGALQRQAAEYQGKLAVSHDELMQNIRDAIKDGLKGLSTGAAVAGTVEAAADAAVDTAAGSVPDDFGFGTSAPDSDGFGF